MGSNKLPGYHQAEPCAFFLSCGKRRENIEAVGDSRASVGNFNDKVFRFGACSDSQSAARGGGLQGILTKI